MGISEHAIINKFFSTLTAGSKESQSLKDDVAILSSSKDGSIIVSKDILVEDVHFLRSDGAFKIASRLLRSSVSDVASSGATPTSYVLGFSIASWMDEEFVSEFCKGLREVQREFKIALIGGDTVSTKDKATFSITIFGKTPSDVILSRQNAKPSDLIFVSGYIGDAYLGRVSKTLGIEGTEYLRNRYYFPDPRIKLGQALLKSEISKCAIDVSDGLLADVAQICKSSSFGNKKVSAFIEQNKIPISQDAKDILDNHAELVTLLDLISAGDDYETIFTASKSKRSEILKLSRELKIPITEIGHIEKSGEEQNLVILMDPNGKRINTPKLGYEHSS